MQTNLTQPDNLNRKPRILIITPEVTYLPREMGRAKHYIWAKAGEMADISAALFEKLLRLGADVHIALPNYRAIFRQAMPPIMRREALALRRRLPSHRVHLAEDCAFYYLNRLESGASLDNLKLALVFQREVLHHIIPEVEPDLIHCNDWLTGLIPAMTRRLGIPTLFSMHHIDTHKTTLNRIAEQGIDAESIYDRLYYERMPQSFDESRWDNNVDLLLSGIFAAHYISLSSPSFLREVLEGQHAFLDPRLRHEVLQKWDHGCAGAIPASPDPHFNPAIDQRLAVRYSDRNQHFGKKENKVRLQERLGWLRNPGIPLFFWPLRLDGDHRGCDLMASILCSTLARYTNPSIAIVFMGEGKYKSIFRKLVDQNHLQAQVAVCDMDEDLAHLALGAADFILMPPRYESSGVTQMIGPLYGALPVAFNTGAIRDAIQPVNLSRNTGNGFLFEHHDATGLAWAIDQALQFFKQPEPLKNRHIAQVMRASLDQFNYGRTANQYIQLYEHMLKRPLFRSHAREDAAVPAGERKYKQG